MTDRGPGEAVPITFVPTDLWTALARVRHGCTPDDAVGYIVAAMRADPTTARPDEESLSPEQHPFLGEVYYGPESTTSPFLSFACIRGAGVFVAVKEDDCVYAHSEDCATIYQIQWGQNDVTLPRALIVPLEEAIHIVSHFCHTGSTTPDDRWLPYAELGYGIHGAEGV